MSILKDTQDACKACKIGMRCWHCMVNVDFLKATGTYVAAMRKREVRDAQMHRTQEWRGW